MWGGLTQLPRFPPHPQPRHKRSPRWLQGSPRFIREWRGRPPVTRVAPHDVKSLPGFLQSLLDRGWPCRQKPQGCRQERKGGGGSWQPLQRMIWLVKLRLSSLCGRTIEFRMSTSAGIRTRQPAAWTRAAGGGRGEGRGGKARGQELGATAIREGSFPAHLCPGLLPPVTHTGPGAWQALGKCLLKNKHTHTHAFTHMHTQHMLP